MESWLNIEFLALWEPKKVQSAAAAQVALTKTAAADHVFISQVVRIRPQQGPRKANVETAHWQTN